MESCVIGLGLVSFLPIPSFVHHARVSEYRNRRVVVIIEFREKYPSRSKNTGAMSIPMSFLVASFVSSLCGFSFFDQTKPNQTNPTTHNPTRLPILQSSPSRAFHIHLADILTSLLIDGWA
jgi:hypothetical protein